MTLKDIIDIIEKVSLKMPNIKTSYEGSVYDLNSKPDIEHTVTVLTQRTHDYDWNNQMWTFNFVLFYVDKLTNDESNRQDIQSNGIIALHNIVRNVCEITGLECSFESYDTFTESFASLCAGAYVSFDLQCPDWNCGYEIDVDDVEFDDPVEPINDDEEEG